MRERERERNFSATLILKRFATFTYVKIYNIFDVIVQKFTTAALKYF